MYVLKITLPNQKKLNRVINRLCAPLGTRHQCVCTFVVKGKHTVCLKVVSGCLGASPTFLILSIATTKKDSFHNAILALYKDTIEVCFYASVRMRKRGTVVCLCVCVCRVLQLLKDK